MADNGKRKLSEAQLATLRKHQFKPGDVGNPKGRPRSKRLSTAFVRALAAPGPDGRAAAEIIAEALVKRAMGGDPSACRELADRTEGKATQPIAVPEGTIHVGHFRPLSDANALRLLERLTAECGLDKGIRNLP